MRPASGLRRSDFPHSGIISLVIDLASGEMIEAAMIGRDSMVGAASAMNGQISLNKAIVQLAGTGSSLDAGQFRKVADQSATFRVILNRHEELLFAQAQQSCRLQCDPCAGGAIGALVAALT